MKLLKSARLLSIGAIALMMGGIGTSSVFAVEPSTGWVITGPDGFGGNFIVSTGTQVGQLNSVTFPATSGTAGGDYVTLNAGTIASANSGATIEFNGPNNVFLNNGIVQGPFEDTPSSQFANTAVGFQSFNSINNEQIINHGSFFGGNGFTEGFAPIANTGLGFLASNGIYNTSINNFGGIYGGSNFINEEEPLLALGDGIVLYDGGEIADINAAYIKNSGVILGGTSVGGADVAGTAVTLLSRGNVTNFNITNLAGGLIQGGNDTQAGFVIGNGVAVVAGFENSAFINSGTVNNAGTILGGSDAFHSGYSNGNLNIAGSGVVFWGGNGVYNITVNNSGLIAGGDGSGEISVGENGILDQNFGSVASTGVAVFDANRNETDINGVSISNSGTIRGGNDGAYAYIVGSGVGIVGLGNVSNISVTNTSTGLIHGGNNNEGSGEFFGPAVAGTGLGIVAGANDNGSYSVSGVAINNAGLIQGGNNNYAAEIIGTGVGIWASDGVYGVNIFNTGNIDGGNINEGSEGTYIAGNGIGIYDDNNQGKDINGVVITNIGQILGGGENYFTDMAGVGVGILGDGNVSNIVITNFGTIAGGIINSDETSFSSQGILVASFDGDVSNVLISNSGNILGGTVLYGEPFSISEIQPFKSNSGYGAAAIDIEGDAISNVTISNSGNIIGGTLVNGESGGDGIDIFGNTLSNITINNYGLIAGGKGGVFGEGEGGDGGYGIDIESEIDPDLTIFNGLGALITGGNAGGAGGSGGDGVYLDIAESSGVSITNYGTIRGGNAGSGGTAGIGIESYGDNLTINNWGVIAAGSGLAPEGTTAGYPAVAIKVQGNNNVINLNGHSSVLGTIQGVNQGGNNYLNLNFTGLSPQAIANLKSQLANQGYPSTNDFHGTFTVRGVTYYVDPLILNINLSSYQLLGLTPNQSSVGANLDSIPVNPTGGLLALYNAIDASGNVPLALEALSPQPYQIYGDIAEATANFMTLSIDERLNNLRDGSESIDTSGIGGGSDKTTSAGYDKDGKNVVVPEAKSLQKRWGFFAEGSGLFTHIDAHGGDLSNAGFTTSGLMLGVDGKVNDHLVLGGLFNYDSTVADLDTVGSKANVQTLGGGIYAGYHNGDWYGNGLAAYGHNDYDSHRNIFIPGFNTSAQGSTHGGQESINIDGGYDFHMLNNKLTVGPLAGLQYVHLDVDGFNEAGAGAADLAVGSQSVDSFRSRIGFRADYHTQISKEVAFATEIRAAWQHEFLDDSRVISSAFIGSGLGAFGVLTTKPQRDAALVGVGANITVRDRMTLFFDYDVQAGQQSYLEQSVKGGIKLSF